MVSTIYVSLILTIIPKSRYRLDPCLQGIEIEEKTEV